MRMIQRSAYALAVGILGAFVVWAAPSKAEPWPQRTVRVIVPLPPGGGTDAIARRAMQRLSEALGVPVGEDAVRGKTGAGAGLARP